MFLSETSEGSVHSAVSRSSAAGRAHSRVSLLKRHVKKLDTLITEKDEQLEQLTHEVQRKNRLIESKDQRLATFMRKLQTFNSRIEDKDKLISNKNEEISSLNQKNNNMKAVVAQMKKKLRKAQENSRVKSDKTIEGFSKLAHENQHLRRERDDLAATLDATIDGSLDKMQPNFGLKLLKRRNQFTSKQFAELERIVRNQQSVVEDMTEMMKNSQVNVSPMLNENQLLDLRKSIAALTEEKGKIEEILQHTLHILEDAHNQHKGCDTTIDNQHQHIQHLEKNHQQLQSEMRQKADRIKHLEKENASLSAMKNQQQHPQTNSSFPPRINVIVKSPTSNPQPQVLADQIPEILELKRTISILQLANAQNERNKEKLLVENRYLRNSTAFEETVSGDEFTRKELKKIVSKMMRERAKLQARVHTLTYQLSEAETKLHNGSQSRNNTTKTHSKVKDNDRQEYSPDRNSINSNSDSQNNNRFSSLQDPRVSQLETTRELWDQIDSLLEPTQSEVISAELMKKELKEDKKENEKENKKKANKKTKKEKQSYSEFADFKEFQLRYEELEQRFKQSKKENSRIESDLELSQAENKLLGKELEKMQTEISRNNTERLSLQQQLSKVQTILELSSASNSAEFTH